MTADSFLNSESRHLLAHHRSTDCPPRSTGRGQAESAVPPVSTCRHRRHHPRPECSNESRSQLGSQRTYLEAAGPRQEAGPVQPGDPNRRPASPQRSPRLAVTARQRSLRSPPETTPRIARPRSHSQRQQRRPTVPKADPCSHSPTALISSTRSASHGQWRTSPCRIDASTPRFWIRSRTRGSS